MLLSLKRVSPFLLKNPHLFSAVQSRKGAEVVSAAGSKVGSRRDASYTRSARSRAQRLGRRHGCGGTCCSGLSATGHGRRRRGSLAMGAAAAAASVAAGLLVRVRDCQALALRRRFPSTAALRNEKADGARRSRQHTEGASQTVRIRRAPKSRRALVSTPGLHGPHSEN